MRQFLTVFLFIAVCCSMANTYAQQVDYNSIILPENAVAISFEEKLVQLAWKNSPANRVLFHQRNAAEFDMQQARWSFLDNLRAVGNINDIVLEGREEETNRFFPLYNLSATVSVGMFVNIPLETKKRREQVYIAEANINQQKILVRAEVLRRHEIYLQNKEIMRIQTETTEDAYSRFLIAEESFTNGEIDLEVYNTALERYNNEQNNKIRAQAELRIAEINIEELIGVKLEDVE